MRENEFEKRVQEKMKEFDLPPSAAVWTEVERRIRKEKKRRFIFWWPLFFLLAGGGITAGLLLSTKKQPAEPVAVHQQKVQHTTTPVENKIQQVTATNNADSIPPVQTGNYNHTGNVKLADEETGASTGPLKMVVKTDHPPGGNEPRKVNQPKKEKPEDDRTAGKTAEPSTGQPVVPADPVPVSPKEDEKLKETAGNSDRADEGKNKDVQQKEIQGAADRPVTDSFTKKGNAKPPVVKTKKGEWEFHFSAGRSNLADGLHLFNGRLYADASTLQAGSSGNPVPGISPSASVIRPSFSWTAGVNRRYFISDKLALNAGLNYTYLSTRINVGTRVDSSRSINNSSSQGLFVSDFYGPSGNAVYTNRYHFISLSGDISWRIINRKQLKLYWENGLAYGRLLGSTMLHYDRGLPGYYKDNKLLTKDNLFFSTGLMIPAGERWSINPFTSYGLTRVLKNADSNRTHYSNFGIRIRYLLKKK